MLASFNVSVIFYESKNIFQNKILLIISIFLFKYIFKQKLFNKLAILNLFTSKTIDKDK